MRNLKTLPVAFVALLSSSPLLIAQDTGPGSGPGTGEGTGPGARPGAQSSTIEREHGRTETEVTTPDRGAAAADEPEGAGPPLLGGGEIGSNPLAGSEPVATGNKGKMGCRAGMKGGMKGGGMGMMREQTMQRMHEKHRDLVVRLDLLDARMAKIEVMLERLLQR